MKKTNLHAKSRRLTDVFQHSKEVGVLVLLISSMLTYASCGKDGKDPLETNADYAKVALVADVTGYNADRIDPDLSNPWGIAIGSTGAFWISANHSGYSTVYDRTGAELLPSVDVPFNGNANGGAPTGVVYNSTTDFVIPSKGEPAKFIYVTENGTVAAWSSGTETETVADRSANNAVYKGLAIANDGGANFIYAANFKQGKVDVFDANFQYVTGKPFNDPDIPSSFAPFNVQNINGQLYVTYAKQKGPDNKDDEKGIGNGYIDIFNPDGTLIKRFASNGNLNSPWAVTTVPDGFGIRGDAILVGNFGNGRINIFDPFGNYVGQLKSGGSPIIIDGLWALVFPKNNIPAGDPNQLFYTAGPANEAHGVFGYIKKK